MTAADYQKEAEEYRKKLDEAIEVNTERLEVIQRTSGNLKWLDEQVNAARPAVEEA